MTCFAFIGSWKREKLRGEKKESERKREKEIKKRERKRDDITAQFTNRNPNIYTYLIWLSKLHKSYILLPILLDVLSSYPLYPISH